MGHSFCLGSVVRWPCPSFVYTWHTLWIVFLLFPSFFSCPAVEGCASSGGFLFVCFTAPRRETAVAWGGPLDLRVFFETSSDKSGLFFCCWDLVRTCLLLLPFPPCRIFTDGGEESRREVIHGGRRYPAAMCPNGKGMLLFPSCLGNLVTE